MVLPNTTIGCEPRAVANSNMRMQTTSGCKPRAVANYEWLRTTSGCWHSSWKVFLKVGICIDDKTWEKDWYHWVSVFKTNFYCCDAEFLRLQFMNGMIISVTAIPRSSNIQPPGRLPPDSHACLHLWPGID